MNNEIMTLLENLQNIVETIDIRPRSDNFTNINDSDIKLLLDYITNLQEENEDLKDRLKVMNHFKNSLFEENERLKEKLKSIKSNYKIQLEYDENLEKLNNANYLSFIDINKKRLKAIEFIKEEAGYDEEIRSCCCDLLYSDCDKLIELLGGDDKQ